MSATVSISFPRRITHSLAEVAKAVPKGVICLISALQFYELTLQAPPHLVGRARKFEAVLAEALDRISRDQADVAILSLHPLEADMAKLKLGSILDEKPVQLTVELPVRLQRDLVAYGEILGREAGQGAIKPVRLIVSMLERFIATDRAFAKGRRAAPGRGPDTAKQRPL